MKTKMGGQETLSVLVLGDGHLKDIVLSRAEGGRKHDLGLTERAHAATGTTTLEILHADRPSMSLLAAKMHSSPDGSLSTALHAADIVILSLTPDVMERAASDDFLVDAGTVVEAIKGAACHVIALNASTIDPTNLVSNYHGIPEPFTRAAQRLDLALLKLSISHGISIIDADRILAELGAEQHVVGPLDYSSAASEAICEEAFRIIDDYGFFERRPVMAQVGQATKEES